MKLNPFIIRFITFKYNLEINKMGKKYKMACAKNII